MEKSKFYKLFFILFSFYSFFSFAQNINRYKHNERQGRWIIYQDSTNKQIDNIGRYRKGIPKGTWKYYDSQGHLIKKEKYLFGKIKTNYYYPNGRIQKQGMARILISEKVLHYFYYGDWLTYDTNGVLITKQVYKDGTRISETNFRAAKTNTVNDSIVMIVEQMNADINKYSNSLLSAESKHGKSSKEYQRIISLNNLNAIKVFDEIDKLITKYGYPGKTLVGKDYAIVFSIISSASLKYKEKYYDVILQAADAKELDWTDVAFFVDKVKVEKKEKQVYGTQYKFGDTSITYYPILDKEKLNERRKKIGLEEVDISKMNDTQPY